MIDKNGKKIFASLSEDGVGGDDVKFKEITYINFVTGEIKKSMMALLEKSNTPNMSKAKMQDDLFKIYMELK